MQPFGPRPGNPRTVTLTAVPNVVRLLGPPRVERAGDPLPVPRGRKPWALLAIVLTSTGPVPRTRVLDLLFPDAADPQAALRWTLSQARRAVGDLLEIGDDPLRWRPADGVTVDVLDVLAGRVSPAWPLAEATLPLLEGAEPDVPEFGTWLLGRRRSLQEAGARLQRARTFAPAGPSAVADMVALGRQMLDTGAARDGVRVLAGAVRRARVLADDAVLAEALAHYGGGMVHAVASTDRAAQSALREADRLASRLRSSAMATLARRELGFVAAATGDLPGALVALDAATAAASTAADRAGVHYFRGFALVDAGRSAAALHELDAAAQLAEDADRPRMLTLSLAFRARARLQRDEDDRAVDDIEAARALVTSLGWTAVRPWIDSLRAEVLLRAGRTAEAEQVVTDARSLAEVLDDSCWSALATRGLAQVYAAQGRPAEAAGLLTQACTTYTGGTDVCVWIELSMRDLLCGITSAFDRAAALREADTLTRLAVRTGLVEFATRAAVHRVRLGREDARAEARIRSADQGNPALVALTAGI